MKLGYQAPLPPSPTGVAQYAATLLRHLKKDFEISNDAPLQLYQVGNNELHWGIYQSAIERPGVVLLHDACLHHLLLGKLTREQYVEEFVHNYGEWFRQTGERYWESRSNSAADSRFFERPMLRRLAESSLGVIVHNPAAEAAVLAHAPKTKVLRLPHLFEPLVDRTYREVDDYREQILGVPRDRVLFAVLGHLRESKRLDSVLRAIESLRRHGLNVHLLVQGSFVGPDLEHALEGSMNREWIVRRKYLPEDEWWLQAHAIDVGINLRWPLAGESSGIATRLMGIGKPVVMTRSLETSDIPEVAAIQIDPGPPEQEQLEMYLAWLAMNADARRAIGRHAAIHIHEFHRVDLVAARLASFLKAGFDGKATQTLR